MAARSPILENVRLAVDVAKSVVAPALSRYKDAHRPSADLCFMAIGPRGAFDGIEDEIRSGLADILRDCGPHDTLRGLYGGDKASPIDRMGHGEEEIVLLAPANRGLNDEDANVARFFEMAYERVAARARRSVMVEFGSDPRLGAPLSVIGSEGEAREGDPAIAMAAAQWCGHGKRPYFQMIRMGEPSASEGILRTVTGGATALFAVRRTGDEAAQALADAMQRFSNEVTVVRAPGETPQDAVVVALAEGRAFNFGGEEISLEPEAVPRP